MKVIKVAKAASKGIAIGKAFVVTQEKIEINQGLINDVSKEAEISKFDSAVAEAIEQIQKLAVNNEIFAAHLEVAGDIFLKQSVHSKISENNYNVELALDESKNEICAMFDTMEDEYLKERAADIKDVCKRIMYIIKGISLNPFGNICEDVVIIANDLAPSDTSLIDFDKAKGFITELGGVTSHVCIMARSMGIPAIVGVNDFMQNVTNSDYIILDGLSGQIFINPDDSTIAEYKAKLQDYIKMKKDLESMIDLRATTTDGHTVELCANVGNIEDIEKAIKNGAEGVGLFRSEFLYMESKSSFPSEEMQFETYKKAAELCGERPVIIRTLDIGGDKELPYYEFEKEENPFLGWRAIRISLTLRDVFKSQLRALLRASAFGNVKIMYPMIISVEEYRLANQILEECKAELLAENIAFNNNIETGIMIETPAAVICAEFLAKEVSFFSIGTNDLTQYLLAVDRGNQKIANLYNSFHPAVLRSIKHIIECGHKYNKMVGMCGEFASDDVALPILLGLGLDEFSMSSNEISSIKFKIRNSSFKDSKDFAEKICSLGTFEEIKALI